jgi:hypothetical protein
VTETTIQLVVCDAGPIIHLDELDCLRLLEDFPEVLIPDVVWDEVMHHRPQAIPICEQIAKKVTPKQSLSVDIYLILKRRLRIDSVTSHNPQVM